MRANVHVSVLHCIVLGCSCVVMLAIRPQSVTTVFEKRLEDLPVRFCMLGQADGASPSRQIRWELDGAREELSPSGSRQFSAPKNSPAPLFQI